MKFCSKCGQELVDEAVVCTGCGCPVTSTYQAPSSQAKAVSTKTPTEKNWTPLHVFHFVFAITAALSIFFLMLSLAYPYISTYVSSATVNIESEVYYIYSYPHTHSITEIYYPDGGYAILGLLTSFVAWIFACVSFIFSLVKRATVDKILPSIARLFIALLLIILSIAIGVTSW